jgi:dTDP-4-amino-4,6-dideoxygalactose transaminase
MDAIMALADKYNLVVIEDCAHAHGGKWRERGAGSWGHFGSYSMQLTKTLTSGEGGLITTSVAGTCRAYHSHYRFRTESRYAGQRIRDR